MVNAVYTLPPISFVGGESQKLRFNFTTVSGNPFDAYGCTAVLAVLQYNNKGGTPIITKDIDIQFNTSDVLSIGIAELLPEDTVNLHGRYIYQITVRAADGTVEIPGQGLMDIISNIYPSYLS